MTVEIRDQASKEIRLQEIEKRMGVLTAKKRRLHSQVLSSSGATVAELNRCEREFSQLDLERYELER